MSEGDSKDFIGLEQAMEVFWSKGYEATSVQDLVESMGVNRSTLYGTYGDKRHLFCRAVDLYSERLLSEIHRQLDREGSQLGNIRAFIEYFVAKAARSRRLGCLINSTAIEASGGDKVVGEKVSGVLGSVEDAFRGALQRAVDNGELAPQVDIDALARFCLCFLQGLTVLSKAGFPARSLEDCERVMNSFFNGLASGSHAELD